MAFNPGRQAKEWEKSWAVRQASGLSVGNHTDTCGISFIPAVGADGEKGSRQDESRGSCHASSAGSRHWPVWPSWPTTIDVTMDGNLASHPSVTRRVGHDVDETIRVPSFRLEGLLPVHIAASSCCTKTRKDNNDPRSRPNNPFVYRSTSFGSRRPGKKKPKNGPNCLSTSRRKYVGPGPSSSSFFILVFLSLEKKKKSILLAGRLQRINKRFFQPDRS